MERQRGGQDTDRVRWMHDVQGNTRIERRRSVFSLSLEQALRASDEILELLPIATCVCDAAGRILQYNQRAVELWGRAPEPGQTHDEFTRSASSSAAKARSCRAPSSPRCCRTGRAIRDEEVTVQRTDGKQIVVLLNIDPLVDAARQAGRRDQLLPGRHRAQAHDGCARPQPARPARAGGALERHLRARRDRHRRARRRRPVHAGQRGDLLDRRRHAARSCWAGGCRAAPIPTTATSTRSFIAGRWPATSASIRSKSASSARTAA